ncbi:hypothetical protein F5Y03DRAFT_348691 [Xylaria venustula]|nr:hypothetical protein F5Y03DRAFT_348691 [Xylaria venustula]
MYKETFVVLVCLAHLSQSSTRISQSGMFNPRAPILRLEHSYAGQRAGCAQTGFMYATLQDSEQSCDYLLLHSNWSPCIYLPSNTPNYLGQ